MEESSSMESGQPPASHSRRASLRTNNGERYSRTTAPPSGQRIVYGLDNNLGMSAWDFINFGSGPIPMNSTSPSVTKSAPSSLFRRITSGLVFPEEVANVDEGKRRRRCRCSWRAVKNWMTLYFDDPEKERHYRSWWWSKYHRRWLICCMILLAGNILLFSQYVLLAVLSERNGCFGLSQGWCPPNSPVSTEYKWRSDVMIFLIGSFLPSVALLAMHYRLPTSYLSQRCHYIFLICCSLNFTGSFIIRPRVVDPDGDMWLYGLFNLISIAWLPCIASLPSHMTCILGIINFIAYVSAFASSMDDRHSLSYHCMVVYLACGVCTATGITRVLENIERRMFVMSYGLRTVNEGLKIRLKGLEKQYSFQAADMDSPLEKAIGAIKSVMANPSLDAATFKHLGYVLSWLSDTDKLLIPDFGGQLSGAVVGVDQEHEVKTWLLNLLPGQSRASRSKRQIQRPGNSGTTSAQDSFAEGQSRVDILSLLPARYDSPTFAADPATLEEGLSSLSGPEYVEPSPSTSSLPSSAAPNSPFLAGFGTNSSGFVGKDYLRNPLFDSNAPLLPPLNQAGVVKERELRRRGSVDRSDQSKDNPRVKALLATMDQWNWSIFELESVTAGRPLAIMGMHVMSVSGISDRLKIPADKMQRFMRRIELVYRPEVPYHNASHAADVLQAMYCFLASTTLEISDLELFSSYLAAIVHDLDHPGLNNNFLIATHNSKAILYNDRSVLENHHLATAFSIMLREETDILSSLSVEDSRKVREQIIDMVLATDMAGHFTTLAIFKNKVSASANFDPINSPDDRSLLFRMLIKCADVSNLTREWPVYCAWLDRLIKEFVNQGDEEKRLGLPVSPFMDRDNINIPQSQLGFIEFLCQPMLEEVNKVTPLQPMLDTLLRNKDVLINMRERDSKKKLLASRVSLSMKSSHTGDVS